MQSEMIKFWASVTVSRPCCLSKFTQTGPHHLIIQQLQDCRTVHVGTLVLLTEPKFSMWCGRGILQNAERRMQNAECRMQIAEWVIPEKIHTSPTDGTLEILAGGGVEGSGNPGGRGVLDLKLFFGGH